MSVVVSSVDARCPRRTDREQVEAQPFDRNDIADVGLVEQVTAPDAELEVLVGKPIRLQTEALYLQDQYDVVLM